jgi:hypothetical protein
MGRRTPRGRYIGQPPAVADPDKVNRMLDAIRAGVPITQACYHAGVHPSTHHRAMESGEKADARAEAGEHLDDRDELYRDYRNRVLSARARVATVHLALIGKAAVGGQVIEETTRRYKDEDGNWVEETTKKVAPQQWKASTWLLERSFREDFAPQRNSVEVTGVGGGPVQVDAGSPEATLQTVSERLSAVLAKRQQELPGGWDRPEDAPYTIDGEVDEG